MYDVTYILDGNKMRVHEGKKGPLGGKIEFVTALDLIKCLKQLNYLRLLLTFASISELPSNISTMLFALKLPRNQMFLLGYFKDPRSNYSV